MVTLTYMAVTFWFWKSEILEKLKKLVILVIFWKT